MNATSTARMHAIADELAYHGNTSAARLVIFITAERDAMANALRHMIRFHDQLGPADLTMARAALALSEGQ